MLFSKTIGTKHKYGIKRDFKNFIMTMGSGHHEFGFQGHYGVK